MSWWRWLFGSERPESPEKEPEEQQQGRVHVTTENGLAFYSARDGKYLDMRDTNGKWFRSDDDGVTWSTYPDARLLDRYGGGSGTFAWHNYKRRKSWE